MKKIEIIITDDFNGIKQISSREYTSSCEASNSLEYALETIEDCLRGLGFTFEGHLTIVKE
jgi:hypothetical protein